MALLATDICISLGEVLATLGVAPSALASAGDAVVPRRETADV